MVTPDPSGCRYCGVGQREHMQRWKPSVGWHAWTAPTWAQRRERILARHAADTDCYICDGYQAIGERWESATTPPEGDTDA